MLEAEWRKSGLSTAACVQVTTMILTRGPGGDSTGYQAVPVETRQVISTTETAGTPSTPLPAEGGIDVMTGSGTGGATAGATAAVTAGDTSAVEGPAVQVSGVGARGTLSDLESVVRDAVTWAASEENLPRDERQACLMLARRFAELYLSGPGDGPRLFSDRHRPARRFRSAGTVDDALTVSDTVNFRYFDLPRTDWGPVDSWETLIGELSRSRREAPAIDPAQTTDRVVIPAAVFVVVNQPVGKGHSFGLIPTADEGVWIFDPQFDADTLRQAINAGKENELVRGWLRPANAIEMTLTWPTAGARAVALDAEGRVINTQAKGAFATLPVPQSASDLFALTDPSDPHIGARMRWHWPNLGSRSGGSGRRQRPNGEPAGGPVDEAPCAPDHAITSDSVLGQSPPAYEIPPVYEPGALPDYSEPDPGDCLMRSLQAVALHVLPPEAHTVEGMRNRLAAALRDTRAHRNRLRDQARQFLAEDNAARLGHRQGTVGWNEVVNTYLATHPEPEWDTIIENLRTPGSWNNAAGDIAPLLAAWVFNLTITVYGPYHTPYQIGPPGGTPIGLYRNGTHWAPPAIDEDAEVGGENGPRRRGYEGVGAFLTDLRDVIRHRSGRGRYDDLSEIFNYVTPEQFDELHTQVGPGYLRELRRQARFPWGTRFDLYWLRRNINDYPQAYWLPSHLSNLPRERTGIPLYLLEGEFDYLTREQLDELLAELGPGYERLVREEVPHYRVTRSDLDDLRVQIDRRGRDREGISIVHLSESFDYLTVGRLEQLFAELGPGYERIVRRGIPCYRVTRSDLDDLRRSLEGWRVRFRHIDFDFICAEFDYLTPERLQELLAQLGYRQTQRSGSLYYRLRGGSDSDEFNSELDWF